MDNGANPPRSEGRHLLFIVNVDWFFLSHRLEIARLAKKQGYRVGIATGLTDRKEELIAEGFDVYPLHFERASTGIGAAKRLFLELVSVLRRVRPDIVHLVTIKPVLLGGLAAKLVGISAVVSAVSGLGFVFLARGRRAKAMRFLVSILYRAAMSHPNSIVIFQNTDDQSMVSNIAKLPADKSIIIRGSGVNLGTYRFTPLPEGIPVVLLAARLLIDKGVREFVDAAQLLKANAQAGGPLARFVLVGDIDPGNAASLTSDEIERWRAEEIVEIWGHRNDMAAVLAQSTLVVLPSYREGLPKILVEAAACGRPVITTDVPGCRDAIDNGVTGRLVPLRDPVALANEIGQLLDNPLLCAEMGRNARKLAEREFDVMDVAKKHIDIYGTLLKRSAR